MASILMIACFMLSSPGLKAQQSQNEPSPKPYAADEFPQWAQDLRRFEVISLGSWPISYFWTNIIYDIARWAVLAIQGNGTEAARMAPLFFAPANKPPNTDAETTGIILGSVGLALAVGLADHLIESDRRTKAAEREAFLKTEMLRKSLELEVPIEQDEQIQEVVPPDPELVVP
jgi:hypothetical protein